LGVGSPAKRSVDELEETPVAMPSKTIRVALVVLLLVAATTPAHAFRCGSRIITRGDHADKILRYCGEPVAVHSWLKQRSYVLESGVVLRGALEEIVVEEWTYNLGPRHLMRVVRLENGYVEEIKHLGYGY
jgi:hypothetical protein